MTFKKWNSIENFRTFYNDLVHYKTSVNPEAKMDFTFDGKVKLHGTNAIIQIKDGKLTAGKRTSFIDIDHDNCGFAKWVANIPSKMRAMLKSNLGSDYFNDTYIYGEWIGPGVQNGVAASQIEKKVFAVFSIRSPKFSNNIAYKDDHEPWKLMKILFEDIEDMIFIESYSSLSVDLENRDSVVDFQAKINELVDSVCKCDPFIEKHFGIKGPGEGLVWYSDETIGDGRLLFKTKGEKFAEVKQKTPTDIDYEKVNNLSVLAENICTDHRLQKKLDESNLSLDIRNMGEYLKIVNADVLKECRNEIIASEYEWKEISKYVSKRAANFFKHKVFVEI